VLQLPAVSQLALQVPAPPQKRLQLLSHEVIVQLFVLVQRRLQLPPGQSRVQDSGLEHSTLQLPPGHDMAHVVVSFPHCKLHPAWLVPAQAKLQSALSQTQEAPAQSMGALPHPIQANPRVIAMVKAPSKRMKFIRAPLRCADISTPQRDYALRRVGKRPILCGRKHAFVRHDHVYGHIACGRRNFDEQLKIEGDADC